MRGVGRLACIILYFLYLFFLSASQPARGSIRLDRTVGWPHSRFLILQMAGGGSFRDFSVFAAKIDVAQKNT